MIDLLPKHVEQARAKGISAELGDAREDTGLNDYAIRTARIAERHAPHLSIHLLDHGHVT